MTLSDELRQRVIQRLSRGESLPVEWERELFPPERREMELVYAGKQRPDEVAADTLAVPLQEVSSFGSRMDGEWRNALILGDNLQVCRHLLDLKRQGKLLNADGSVGVRAIYVDPPFAADQDFQGRNGDVAYSDRIAGAEFVEFLRRRFILLRQLLSDDGSLFVHMDQRRVHYMKVILDEVFGESNFRNEIILPGRASKNLQQQFDSVARLNVRHDTLLWYSASPATRFSPLWVEKHNAGNPEGHWHHFWSTGNRPTMRYELYGITPETGQWTWKQEKAEDADANYRRFVVEGGGRTLAEYWRDTGKCLRFIKPDPEDGKPLYWRAPADLRLADTVWSGVPVYSNSTGYPTEKSEALLEQVLELATSEGDLCMDAFSGSGTTVTVAARMGRRWVGIDCGRYAIYTAQKRVLSLAEGTERSFSVYNAGLYDFSTLKELDWDSWLFFCLELFGCRHEESVIGGIAFQGKRHGFPVLVHNHVEKPRARIDEGTIDSLHQALGERAGSKVFIVAPRNVFRFQQDYIERGNTRYYALRIPYSFIEELHKRGFSALTQPQDSGAVNATVESVGFDFVEPPDFELEVGKAVRPPGRARKPFARFKSFQSRARLRQGPRTGFEGLSLVMVDLDYDGEVFDMDAVHFAQDMKDADWTVWLDGDAMGARVMLVVTDIYGNEARHVLARTEFGGRR